MKLNGLGPIVVASFLTIAAAYALGTAIASHVTARKERDLKVIRELRTQDLLDRMGTIRVGDTLPNWTFQALDGRYCRLVDLRQEKTLVTIFDYHCDNCLIQLEEIRKAVKDSDQAKHVILISASNPLQLLELQRTYDIRCRILYDEDAMFLDHLSISTYPFNLIVNQSGQITEIFAGSVSRNEIEPVVSHSRKP